MSVAARIQPPSPSGKIMGRYAPSPTGKLHMGNLRTALIAWIQVRLNEGTFVLRMDDLDQPRNRSGAADQIIADLKWLGLDWDRLQTTETPRSQSPNYSNQNSVHYQSQHHDTYQVAFQTLMDQGQLFPCNCSRKDIALAASAPHRRDNTSIYPGTCRPALSAPSIATAPVGHDSKTDADLGRAWRFRVDTQGKFVSFVDELQGLVEQNIHDDVGDFVVKRKDGLFAYQLASVVDDGLMGITDVVRGADLIDSTPRQIALFQSLGLPTPRFWHVPLMHDRDGSLMSKRDGAQSLDQQKAAGKKSHDIVGELAFSAGLVDQPQPITPRLLLQRLSPASFREKLTSHQKTAS